MAKVVAGFGSTTPANTRLLQLTRAGLLSRFFVGSVAPAARPSTRCRQRAANWSEREARRHQPTPRQVAGRRSLRRTPDRASTKFICAVKYRPLPIGARFCPLAHFRAVDLEAIKTDAGRLLRTAVNCRCVRAMFLEVDLGTEALKVWQQKPPTICSSQFPANSRSASASRSSGCWWSRTSERRLQNIRARYRQIHRQDFLVLHS